MGVSENSPNASLCLTSILNSFITRFNLLLDESAALWLNMNSGQSTNHHYRYTLIRNFSMGNGTSVPLPPFFMQTTWEILLSPVKSRKTGDSSRANNPQNPEIFPFCLLVRTSQTPLWFHQPTSKGVFV